MELFFSRNSIRYAENYINIYDVAKMIIDVKSPSEYVYSKLNIKNEYVPLEDVINLLTLTNRVNARNFLEELEYHYNKKPINFTEQQKQVIKFAEGTDANSLIIDAVAGSGKTTTIIGIAEAVPNKSILQFTYNAMLKGEVRDKVKYLHNVEVHSYHSFAVKYYEPKAYVDTVICSIISKNKAPYTSIPNYDLIVVDEAQDMTPLYYRLIRKIIIDSNYQGQIIIMGDRYQGIYEFKKADTRFLTLASKLYTDFNFVDLKLSESKRITNPIAQLVNNMTKSNRISSSKEGRKVQYIVDNPFRAADDLANFLVKQINDKKITPNDIFVLCPSVKSINAPFKKMENILVMNNIPCYVSKATEHKIDEKIIHSKVVFTTFHQSKGRERKVVIIFNFDASYFKYYARSLDPKVCPATLYVGVTRAKEHLYLIHDKKEAPLPFLTFDEELKNYTDIKGKSTFTTSEETSLPSVEHKTCVTELIKYLDDDTLYTLSLLIDQLFLEFRKPFMKVSFTNDIETNSENDNKMYEQVSDLNGLAIPAMWESRHKGHMSTIERNLEKLVMDDKIDMFLKSKLLNLNLPCKTPSDFLLCANLYTAVVEKLYFKISQIPEHNWLNIQDVDKCLDVMEMTLNEESESSYTFEKGINYTYESLEYGNIQITGVIDAVSESTVFEFKCVDTITLEHQLQLLAYCWLWYKVHGENAKRLFKLLNIRTGQVFQINENKMYLLEDVMSVLFSAKYTVKEEKSDVEFIENLVM